MKSKPFLEVLALVFLFFGLGLIIVQPFSITGAAIDLSHFPSQLSFFIGVLLVIVSMVLLVILLHESPKKPKKRV